jgi:hypothetical protein
MFVTVHHLSSTRNEANPVLHFKRSDEMDEKIEIPRWLCYRIETMGDCERREFQGLMRRDYHVIMERLLHIMLHGYFNDDIGKVLAELSYFYRQLRANEIKKDMTEKLEKDILVLICKIERIFPPGWFNPMQHLLVHIPYEAKVDDPVEYRWMYVDISYAAPQAHRIVNVALHLGYSTGIIFV